MHFPTYTPNEGIAFLQGIANTLPPNALPYSHSVSVHPMIELKYPGRFNFGDYLLYYNNQPVTHEQICQLIISDINGSNDKYDKWMDLLADVYNNGTTNINNFSNDEFLIKSLIFWVTLQEQFNYPYGMGRLHPFCRYAEAIGSTQNVNYSFDDLRPRINNQGRNPKIFERLIFPNPPKYYHW